MEMELVNSVYNILPNDALAQLIDRNLRAVGGLKYTPEERSFAETLRKSFLTGTQQALGSEEQILSVEEGFDSGSTDSADVSWIVPTGRLRSATFVPGTPGHSWQNVACAGMSIGRKGMTVAAKTLALSAIDLFTEPKHIEAARASFEKRRAGHVYRSRVPPDQKPPLNYRDN
jgi:aminobenzoyl-glutamate utilization protein B